MIIHSRLAGGHEFNLYLLQLAGMAELADAPDLGSGIERCAGSTPVPGTFKVGL